MIKVNINKLDCDSRGEPLNLGDSVLLYITQDKLIYGVVREREIHLSQYKIYIPNAQAVGVENYYTNTDRLIKIPNYSLQDYLNYYTQILGSSLEKNMCAVITPLIYIIKRMHEEECKRTGKNEPFPVTDYLNRSLKIGDLALCYLPNKGELCYVVIISKTHGITEHGKKVRLNFVVLVENKTQEEELLYKKIILYYNREAKAQSSKNIQPMTGEVYLGGKSYYLYLGNMSLRTIYKQEMNLLYDLNYDENKAFWFKYDCNVDPIDFINTHSLEHIMRVRLECGIKKSDERVNITSTSYAKYTKILGFVHLIQIVKSKLVKVGMINLPDFMLIDFTHGELKGTQLILEK